MQAIIDFFVSLGDSIESVFTWFIDYLGTAFTVTTVLANAHNYVQTFLSWIPAPLIFILTGVIGIAVVYKFFGRT